MAENVNNDQKNDEPTLNLLNNNNNNNNKQEINIDFFADHFLIVSSQINGEDFYGVLLKGDKKNKNKNQHELPFCGAEGGLEALKNLAKTYGGDPETSNPMLSPHKNGLTQLDPDQLSSLCYRQTYFHQSNEINPFKGLQNDRPAKGIRRLGYRPVRLRPVAGQRSTVLCARCQKQQVAVKSPPLTRQKLPKTANNGNGNGTNNNSTGTASQKSSSSSSNKSSGNNNKRTSATFFDNFGNLPSSFRDSKSPTGPPNSANRANKKSAIFERLFVSKTNDSVGHVTTANSGAKRMRLASADWSASGTNQKPVTATSDADWSTGTNQNQGAESVSSSRPIAVDGLPRIPKLRISFGGGGQPTVAMATDGSTNQKSASHSSSASSSSSSRSNPAPSSNPSYSKYVVTPPLSQPTNQKAAWRVSSAPSSSAAVSSPPLAPPPTNLIGQLKNTTSQSIKAARLSESSSGRRSRDDLGVGQSESTVGQTPPTNNTNCPFKINDSVWAKMRSYPYWPAKIFDIQESTACVTWCGSIQYGYVDVSILEPFLGNFNKRYNPKRNASYQKAVADALNECGATISNNAYFISILAPQCRKFLTQKSRLEHKKVKNKHSADKKLQQNDDKNDDDNHRKSKTRRYNVSSSDDMEKMDNDDSKNNQKRMKLFEPKKEIETNVNQNNNQKVQKQQQNMISQQQNNLIGQKKVPADFNGQKKLTSDSIGQKNITTNLIGQKKLTNDLIGQKPKLQQIDLFSSPKQRENNFLGQKSSQQNVQTQSRDQKQSPHSTNQNNLVRSKPICEPIKQKLKEISKQEMLQSADFHHYPTVKLVPLELVRPHVTADQSQKRPEKRPQPIEKDKHAPQPIVKDNRPPQPIEKQFRPLEKHVKQFQPIEKQSDCVTNQNRPIEKPLRPILKQPRPIVTHQATDKQTQPIGKHFHSIEQLVKPIEKQHQYNQPIGKQGVQSMKKEPQPMANFEQLKQQPIMKHFPKSPTIDNDQSESEASCESPRLVIDEEASFEVDQSVKQELLSPPSSPGLAPSAVPKIPPPRSASAVAPPTDYSNSAPLAVRKFSAPPILEGFRIGQLLPTPPPSSACLRPLVPPPTSIPIGSLPKSFTASSSSVPPPPIACGYPKSITPPPSCSFIPLVPRSAPPPVPTFSSDHRHQSQASTRPLATPIGQQHPQQQNYSQSQQSRSNSAPIGQHHHFKQGSAPPPTLKSRLLAHQPGDVDFDSVLSELREMNELCENSSPLTPASR